MTETNELIRLIDKSRLSDKSKDHIKEKLTLFAKMERDEASAEELIRLDELLTLNHSN